MQMVAARTGCKRAMVGTGWANSRPGCINKHYFHLAGGSFLARKADWAQIGCLPTDYCMHSYHQWLQPVVEMSCLI